MCSVIDRVRRKISFADLLSHMLVSISASSFMTPPLNQPHCNHPACTLIGIYQRNARSKNCVHVSGCAWTCACLRTCVFGFLKRTKAPPQENLGYVPAHNGLLFFGFLRSGFNRETCATPTTSRRIHRPESRLLSTHQLVLMYYHHLYCHCTGVPFLWFSVTFFKRV